MAVIKQTGPTTRRGPSYRKAVYLYERNGQLIVAKWPKPKGTKISQKQRDAMEKFRQAQWLTKYIPGSIMAEMIDLVRGTALLPRDLFTAGMYGRLFSIGIEGGGRQLPVHHPHL